MTTKETITGGMTRTATEAGTPLGGVGTMTTADDTTIPDHTTMEAGTKKVVKRKYHAPHLSSRPRPALMDQRERSGV